MALLDRLNEITDAFLAAATDALDLTGAGAPARRYVSSGRPALDCCGQLTVWASFLGDSDTVTPSGGLGGAGRNKVGAKPLLTIFVQATRCAPVQRIVGDKIVLPSVTSLADAAVMTNQDGWALWNHLNEELREGGLAKVCTGAYRDGATAITGEGGCVGWELVYRYPFEGGRFTT